MLTAAILLGLVIGKYLGLVTTTEIQNQAGWLLIPFIIDLVGGD